MKLVVFDCDGTLVDSQHMICAAMHKSYTAHGLQCPPPARILSIIGLSLDEAFQRLAEGEPHPVASLSAGYKAAFRFAREQGAEIEPLYPRAREAILALAACDDVTLGIATGKSVRGVTAVLRHHALLQHFVTIQTADTAPSKPHPGMLLEAMRDTGVAAQDTVMIGDTAFDIEMARAAGAQAIGVAWGYHPAQALRDAGAASVIEDYAQLLPALGRMWKDARPVSPRAPGATKATHA